MVATLEFRAPALDDLERDQWHRDGFLVVRNAINEAQAKRTVEEIENYLGSDESAITAYRDTPIIDCRDGAALWANRQTPRIHEVFSQVMGMQKLWVSIDRIFANMPGTEIPLDLHTDLAWTHHDFDLKVQGLLCLGNTGATGGWECIPGFHRTVEKALAEDAPNPYRVDFRDYESAVVSPAAGDLIIWHSALPYRFAPNRGNRTQYFQYVTMDPAGKVWNGTQWVACGEEQARARVEQWRSGSQERALAAAFGIPQALFHQWFLRLPDAACVIAAVDAFTSRHEIYPNWRATVGDRTMNISKRRCLRLGERWLRLNRDYAADLGLTGLDPSSKELSEVIWRPPYAVAGAAIDPDQLEQVKEKLRTGCARSGHDEWWSLDSLCTLLERDFDIPLKRDPVPLSELGERLIGLSAW